VPALERVGVYTLSVGDRLHRIAVNPAAAAADITPVRLPRTQSAIAPGSPSLRVMELAPALLTVGLLVLLVEWALWLRRLPPVRPAAPRPVIRR
jgi:hypothetical protein